VGVVPKQPKIYHITHVRNLAGIAADQVLQSDARVRAQKVSGVIVGMPHIKERRLAIQVPSHPGTTVGEYVPFYFCPRSVMLYIVYRGNHPDIACREGQESIVHFQADLKATVDWANANDVQWAFTDGNARARLTRFYSDLSDLNQVNWPAVRATDWRNPRIKEDKQAEFLVYGTFPWRLIETIGVRNSRMADQVNEMLAHANYCPIVRAEQGWYY